MLLKDVENFENFSSKNILNYYNEQVLGKTPQNIKNREIIINKAKDLHEDLRNFGQLGDTEKPLVVSAILLALDDNENKNLIANLTGSQAKTDGEKIFDALKIHLKTVNVSPENKKEIMLNQFTIVKDRKILNDINEKLGKTPLKYFTEYIYNNIFNASKSSSTEDLLGIFYGEFIRYSGGDGQSLGVVLTPSHITELFCDLINLQPEDVIFDPCCGTGSFLLSGMHVMLDNAKSEEQKNNIKANQIYGIEIREDMFSIATTNMILRGDGKSNLIRDDFLRISEQDFKSLKNKKFSVGFMNPPYSQRKNKETANLSEIHFVKQLLDSLDINAKCVVIVPKSTMVGKYVEDKEVKKYILKNHTLEGVITLNPDTFYKIGTNPCIAVFTAHQPHPSEKYCKFINFEDDGYEVSNHKGIVETERAKERKKYLISCWLNDAPADNKFMVKTKIKDDEAWLHSFYYINEEKPSDFDFKEVIKEYVAFEFEMVTKEKEYLV